MAEVDIAAGYGASIESSRREESRLRYKPSHVRYLFIAESPPIAVDRFFYFEDVTRADNLFIETMKVVYPARFTSASAMRRAKREFLRQWQTDGFYLIDAVDEPLGRLARRERLEAIRNQLPHLVKRVANVVERDTSMFLISASVHKTCYRTLRDRGFNVVNDEPIDFPGTGRQRDFRQKLQRALRKAGWPGRD